MLSLVAEGAEERDRAADFRRAARALWLWLALARSPSTGNLARFIAGRGELARSLDPVLSFSVDLDARLRALRAPEFRPGLGALHVAMPRSVGLAAVTGLPSSVVGAAPSAGKWWRIWDDGLRCPVAAVTADIGISRHLADGEAALKPRFGYGRLLVVGTRVGDRLLAKALGAEFVEVRSGLEEEALVGLARGFASLRKTVARTSSARGNRFTES